jgi:purine nucleosidase
VNGNVSLPQVFENIQKVLSLIQPSYKPLIAKGAGEPLRGEAVYAHSVHGEDGLGGALIDRKEGEKWWEMFPRSADELITEMARMLPDEIGLIAIGPLTNLALAIQKDPEGMKKLREVVIMGGAVRAKGNITPYAELTSYDPLVAKLVFRRVTSDIGLR